MEVSSPDDTRPKIWIYLHPTTHDLTWDQLRYLGGAAGDVSILVEACTPKDDNIGSAAEPRK